MALIEREFRGMGTSISVLIGPPAGPAVLPAGAMAIAAQAMLVRFEHVLSRFLDDSELSRLNRDPRPQVPASPLLRRAVHAGLWAAERTEGLVDVTVLPAVRAAGYTASRAGLASVPLADALAAAPPRLPARAHADPAWTSITVLDDDAAIRRDPRVLIDLGGIGKGLAADLLADRLVGYERFVIDCGGDVRVGGSRPDRWPVEVEVQHPLTGAIVESFQIRKGAAATSGLDARLWQREDGSFAHHLIDPATAEPAWTGLIAVSAKAPTCVEAEALAKAALLSGPKGAARFLAEHGGLVVHDNGTVEPIPGPGTAP